MVPDVYHILAKGKGIFSNVASPSAKAKLRLLYEVAPIGFIMEAAGAETCTVPKVKADSDDPPEPMSVLDVPIDHLDRRLGACFGGTEEVAKYKQSPCLGVVSCRGLRPRPSSSSSSRMIRLLCVVRLSCLPRDYIGFTPSMLGGALPPRMPALASPLLSQSARPRACELVEAGRCCSPWGTNRGRSRCSWPAGRTRAPPGTWHASSRHCSHAGARTPSPRLLATSSRAPRLTPSSACGPSPTAVCPQGDRQVP
eukprot:scaffold31_cov263-Pinguiococcus_pyrenoidosus.AAC.19